MMHLRSLALALLTIWLSLSSVLADFNYGIETCNEAQGGYINSGFILAKQHDNCTVAFQSDKPGYNIPANAAKPNGIVCSHNVTINLATLTWTSKSIQYGTPMSGKCTKLGPSGRGLNSTCSPFLAVCKWNDRIACTSTICN